MDTYTYKYGCADIAFEARNGRHFNPLLNLKSGGHDARRFDARTLAERFDVAKKNEKMRLVLIFGGHIGLTLF